MPVETELKLRIAPEHMARLRRHPMLKTLESGHAVTRKLINIYFDSPGLDLQRHQMALRLRRTGGKWLQTLKGGGGVEAGLHSRNEWETPVTGEALDLDALKASGGKLPPGVKKKLRPVFTTDFTRSMRQLKFEGAEIELCMDSGAIIAGKKSRPISELELELKNGEPQQLFKLALALLDIVPLEVEHASKAEYAYRLYRGDRPAAIKARLPRLDPALGIAGALRNMIAACLLHVQANVPGAIGDHDEEYLHQVRVGLRRLRVVLAMANKYRQDPELDELRQQVSGLCNRLGRARDWDVFVTQTLAPISAQFPDHAGLRSVMRASRKNRKLQNSDMRAILAAPDFSRLLLRLGCWMQGGYWQESEGDAAASLPDFARRMLEKRSKQVGRVGRQLAAGDEGQLHELRIACKKLRYGTEMFGSLFGTDKTRRHVAALSRLQDIMGILNDITVARRLLDEMGDTAKSSATRALILGWLEHGQARRMVELKNSWKRFSGQAAFWD
ncbi:MAG TPA: CHAD domain-containing protein [Gallionellaceae bacterium]